MATWAGWEPAVLPWHMSCLLESCPTHIVQCSSHPYLEEASSGWPGLLAYAGDLDVNPCCVSTIVMIQN